MFLTRVADMEWQIPKQAVPFGMQPAEHNKPSASISISPTMPSTSAFEAPINRLYVPQGFSQRLFAALENPNPGYSHR